MHLRLAELDGTILLEETFESRSYLLSGRAGIADRVHPRLRSTLEIESDGYHAVLRQGSSALRLRHRNRLKIQDDLELWLDLYPRPDAVPPVRGACPSCGGTLRSSEVFGAYRTMAREQSRCGDCGTSVLSLDAARSTVGEFTDHSASDWVTITVAHRCPKCTRSMLRSRLHTAHGSAEVERCPTCRLVVVDPEDEAALTGQG